MFADLGRGLKLVDFPPRTLSISTPLAYSSSPTWFDYSFLSPLYGSDAHSSSPLRFGKDEVSFNSRSHFVADRCLHRRVSRLFSLFSIFLREVFRSKYKWRLFDSVLEFHALCSSVAPGILCFCREQSEIRCQVSHCTCGVRLCSVRAVSGFAVSSASRFYRVRYPKF
jgi:hypothetical protein